VEGAHAQAADRTNDATKIRVEGTPFHGGDDGKERDTTQGAGHAPKGASPVSPSDGSTGGPM
jgi:hypothetical protein